MAKYYKSSIFNYFKPSIYLKNLDEVNPASLVLNHIKMVICDLDNTLVPHFTRFPTRKNIEFIDRIRQKGILFYIVSNNTKKRVKNYCQKLQCDGFIANAKKPLIRKIKKIIAKNKINVEDIIFIGDQFITDVFAANRLGCKSILVLPIVDQNQKNISNRILSFLDKKIYSKLQRNNILVDSSILDDDIIFL